MTFRRTYLTLVLGLAMFLAAAFTAIAQNTKAQEDRKARLVREIEILDSQIRASDTKNANALNQLNLIQEKIALRKSLIAESDARIKELNSEIGRKQKHIDSLQLRLDTMSFYYNRLVKSAYKNRDPKLWYMYIVASDNLGQGMRRYSFLKNLSREMNTQGKKIKESKAELETERAALLGMKEEAESLRAERVVEMQKLSKEEASSKTTINRLQKEKNQYQKQLASKKKEVEALNKEIARIIAETMKGVTKEKKNSSAKSTPVDYALGKEFSSNKGKLPWPVEGPVVETFGVHYHPVYKQLKLPDSDGISIAVSDGTPVKAVFEGVVKNVIVQPGYNKCVLVQHGDWFTFYCKLGSVSVKAGDKVKTGQVLGTVEPIAGVTQLHFQLWSSKGPQNPLPWLRPK
ncbi:MAG: peptidoglycan DD-metalloendopeptidase family protein [Rikenellaceae bacterium]|nr:peptidoglycan DD-metalloendopeptidase family protein [Rikenellaceae bacterium]